MADREENCFLDRLQENRSDPFLNAAYADTIKHNLQLKKSYYLRAIQLYRDGCISSWHLKYVNCLIQMRQFRTAYLHIGKHNKTVRGFENPILIKAANYHFSIKRYEIAMQLYSKINYNMIWRKKLNFKVALCFKYMGKHQEAAKYLKRHLRQQGEDKKSILTLIHLANVYCHRGKFQKALDIYTEKFTEKDMRQHALFTDIGVCYFKLNDFEISLSHLNKQLSYFNNPSDKENINVNNNNHQNANNNDANNYDKAIKTSICLFYKGLIYSKKCGMYLKAINCFNGVDPRLLSLWAMNGNKCNSVDLEIANCYFQLGSKYFDLSLKFYQKYLGTNPEKPYNALMKMALIYTKQGSHRQALVLYKKVQSRVYHSKLLIKKLKIWYHLGNCQYNLGNFKLALKHYLADVDHDNKNKNKHSKNVIPSLKQIANIYHYKLFKYNKARQFYDKLDKLGQIHKHSMEFQYVECLQHINRFENAAKILRMYVKKYPDDQNAINKLVVLNVIGKLKQDEYCTKLIETAIKNDANSLQTNYIYAFHLNIIENNYCLAKHYLNMAQSLLFNNQHEMNEIDLGICIDVAKLYTMITIKQGHGESSTDLFEIIGLQHFQMILHQFPDNPTLNLCYGQFLCKLNRLDLIDTFHEKLMTESLFCCSDKYICRRIMEYGVNLHKIGRIDYAIQLIKTSKIQNSEVFKHLGVLYTMMRDYKLSEFYFRKSLDADCLDMETNLCYAHSLYKAGRAMDSVIYFKVGFQHNNNKKYGKYVKKELVESYYKAMCELGYYQLCIDELKQMSKHNELEMNIRELIHEMIWKVYGYLCNENKNNYDALQMVEYLKVVYESRVIKDDTCDNDKGSYCDLI